MVSTMNDVVTQARRYLHGGRQELLNVVDSNVPQLSAGELGTVKFADDLTGIGRGSIIEINREQMYVRSIEEASKTANVIRGHNGTPTNTYLKNSVATINPSYPKNDIFLACLDEISSLQGSGLYQFETQEFDYDGDRVYDLTLDLTRRTPLFVHGAVYERSQRSKTWAPTRVQLLRDLDVDDFSSTYGLKVIGNPRHARNTYNSGLVNIRATVAFSFGRPSELTDDLTAFGIDDHVKPIIAVGAAWRMIIGKESLRLNPDSSHGSRRSEEIDPGSISFLARALNRMRNDLIEDAIEHQLKRYPYQQEIV